MSIITKVILLLVLLFSGCAKKAPKVIEVNSIPFPFNVNGTQPYVVWVNGRRVDMPRKDIMGLVDKIGKDNIKGADPSDIHRGWLFSYFKGDPSNELTSKRQRQP
jgi:hypothetical protein